MTVNPEPITVTLNSSSLTQTYNGTPRPAAASVTQTGISVSFSYTYVGTGTTVYGPLPTAPTNVGTYSVTGTVNNTNYTGSANGTLTILPATPTLSFSTIPAQTFGNAPFTVSTTSPSSGAVTYSLTAGQTSAGTVSPTGTVTITGAGTIYLTATQAANGNYAAGSATTSVTIAPEVPALVFGTIPAQTYGNAPFTVSTTSPSTGAVTFSLTPSLVSAGSVSPTGTVTITGAGTIYLTATQAANGNYAAGSATTNVTVAPEVPSLSFNSISAQTYGNAPFSVSATDAAATPSSGAITYSLTAGNTSAGTVSSTGTVTITGVGSIYLTATQAAERQLRGRLGNHQLYRCAGGAVA